MNFLNAISLIDATAHVAWWCLFVVGLVLAVWGARLRQLAFSAVVATLSAVLVWFLLARWWRPFPDPVPWRLYLAGAGVIGALLLGAICRRRLRRFLGAACTVIAFLGLVNVVYAVHPTVGDLHSAPAATEMSWSEFESGRRPDPGHGALVRFELPGSDFPARPALAWVPPAYFTEPDFRPPVLVLLHGNPGGPEDWFGPGQADDIAEGYHRARGGEAPLIVSVDATGSTTGNPLCTDNPGMKAMTYLSREVPDGISERFRVDPDRSRWTVGGLSYGGTCALQIVTVNPKAYGKFLDISGQKEPTTGDHAETVRDFFAGSEEKFRAANPADLLAARDPRYAGIEGAFIAGDRDVESIDALRHLDSLARDAGMVTTYTTVPGKHTFHVWREALRRYFPWIAGDKPMEDI